MKLELITRRDDLVIRRLVLAPGESMFWHHDVCHRFSVVVRGDSLGIQYLDATTVQRLTIYPGQADWDAPEPRVHRAINIGMQPFEEVVTFFLDAPGQDPQPVHHAADDIPWEASPDA